MYFISRTSNSKYKQKVIKIEGKQLISYVLGTFFLQLKEKQVIKELKEQSVIHQQTQHSNKRYRIIYTSSFWLETKVKQLKKQFGIAKILFQNISNPNIRNLLEIFFKLWNQKLLVHNTSIHNGMIYNFQVMSRFS